MTFVSGSVYCFTMFHYLRHPKGAKQAQINKVRKGATPPDAWEDQPVAFLRQIRKYFQNIYISGMSFTEFENKVRNKFPRLNTEMIRYFYYSEKKYENCYWLYSSKRGRVLKERKKIKS